MLVVEQMEGQGRVNRQHHNHGHNNHGNAGGGNGFGYNGQKRQYNNNFHGNSNNGCSNGYRGYGNRRQFQHNSEYHHNNNHYNNGGNGGHGQYQNHHHQNNNNYHHNNNRGNGWYSNGGKKGWTDHNGFQRKNNGYSNQQGGGGPGGLPTLEFEENLVWPTKRGSWNDNCSVGSFYSTSSRNYSPDASPTSDISGSFPPGNGGAEVTAGGVMGTTMGNGSQAREIVLGTAIPTQYEYLVGHGGQSGFYPSGGGNFLYGFTGNGSLPEKDASFDGVTLISTVGHNAVPSESTCSSRAESCTDSPATEKTTDWPDDSDCSEGDGELLMSSTRCQTPEQIYNFVPSMGYDRLLSFIHPPKDFSPFFRHRRMPHHFPREWFDDLDPDVVVKQFSKVINPKENSPGPVVESSFTSLDSAIWNKFQENQQTVETFRRKVELWRDIYRLVRIMNYTPEFRHDHRNFPFFGLQVVGSTMTGFGSNSSDVDMCLVIRDTEVDQRFEAVGRLQSLQIALHSLPFIENAEMIYAKVPILKFRDAARRLDVDLNCNNFVGIRNTHLLYAYAQMDWRLKPLVLIVKLWAHYHGINDAKMMTISSYSLVLMVIHFLQCGVEQPVLPNLQKEFPELFSNNTPIQNVRIHEEMPPWQSKNQMGLGELLVQFLEYYGRRFDYRSNVISIRVGGTISVKLAANFKSTKNDFHQWKLLCVEEPFDRTNTARSVYDRQIFERIIATFYASWQRLNATQRLDSIFTPLTLEELRAVSGAVGSRLKAA